MRPAFLRFRRVLDFAVFVVIAVVAAWAVYNDPRGRAAFLKHVIPMREHTPITSWVALQPGTIVSVDAGTSISLLVMQAGRVTVGGPIDDTAAHADELPTRNIQVAKSFAIGLWPITRGSFSDFVMDSGFEPKGGCWSLTSDGWRQDYGASWQSPGFTQTEHHPVTCVSRRDALAYVRWLSERTGWTFRLPTEAEWTFAAGKVAFWDTPQDVCSFGNVNDLTAKNKVAKAAEPCTDGYMYTSPAGTFAPNTNGLFDMIGNVWEWMADCHNGGYAKLPPDGSPQYTDDCQAYALRGHSWTDPPGPVRLGTRYALPENARQSMVGFRVVMELENE